MLERDTELARLRELITRAAEGQGAAAAVVGPAGIGKTSLLTAAQRLSSQLGLSLLAARGGELERDLPYGVVRQLFEIALHRLPGAERRSALEGAAALAAPVIGAGNGEARGANSTFAVIHGLYWVTINLAQRGPLVITVDDAHWADAASLRFLTYLQRRIDELPVLLMVAARPAAETADAELLEAITGEPGVHSLTLAPLSEDAVGLIVEAALGHAPEVEVVRACYEATRGNPFLCATLATGLAEQGVPAGAAIDQQITELATRSVASVVVGRLGRLPPSAATLARAVAILGTDVEFRHAVALADLDERDATAAADALAAREIVRAGVGLDFVHPLVRAAVRDGIPPAARAALHARAAELLARERAPTERIAMHLLPAEPAAQAWVVECLRTAARHVAARGDPKASVLYLRRALREPPDAVTRTHVLHELGVAQLNAGEPEVAVEHLESAHRHAGGAEERTTIARDLALALTTSSHYEEAVAVLVHALDEANDADRTLTLRLESELHQAAMMQPSLYRAVNVRLDRIDHELPGTTHGERAILATLATEGLLRTQDAAEVRQRAVRAFQGGLLDDQTPYSALWGNAAVPLVLADAFSEARDVCAQAIDDARRHSSPIGLTRAHAVSAVLHHREGAIRDAESDARIAVEVGLQPGFAMSLLALGILVESLVDQGELDAAQTELADAGMEGDIPKRFLATWMLLARGRLRLAQGRIAQAIADFEELGRRGDHGWRPWNPALFAYRSGLALALLSRGERERATVLAEQELALSRRWGTRRAIGVSVRTLGQAETGERGIALLRDSVATLDSSGARLEHARSLVELGAAIRRSGKRSEAREPLQAGLELAHRCGATALADHAHEELLATGARPRRRVRTGIDALTASERRVARMASQGMTNREIAQALFVTLRTVQVHLTHTYQKLDISSRDELPATLATPAASGSD